MRQCYVKDETISCDDFRWIEYDARGYALGRVCDKCVKQKLSKYRPEVLTDSDYEADEPFEPEDF